MRMFFFCLAVLSASSREVIHILFSLLAVLSATLLVCVGVCGAVISEKTADARRSAAKNLPVELLVLRREWKVVEPQAGLIIRC